MQVLLATGLRVCSGRCHGKVVLRPLQWKNICHGYISTLEDGDDVAKISLVSRAPAQPFGDCLPRSTESTLAKVAGALRLRRFTFLLILGLLCDSNKSFGVFGFLPSARGFRGNRLGCCWKLGRLRLIGSWNICSVGLESIVHSLCGLEQVSPKARKVILSWGAPISEELYSLVCLLCCSRVAFPMLRILCSPKPCAATRRALATTFPMAVCASQISSGRV